VTGAPREIGTETAGEITGAQTEHERLAARIQLEYDGLLALLSRKIRNRDLAGDLLNDAVATTLEHSQAGRVPQADQVCGYVFQVAMNLLRNHQRKADNRYASQSNAEALQALAHHDEDAIEAAQLKAQAKALIESLPIKRDREAVTRFYLDEEDKQSICDSLGLNPAQFAQIMTRARQRLREVFDAKKLKHRDFLSLICF
jgi:RNA polymerase sigma-70 factor (ECF subfamily)